MERVVFLIERTGQRIPCLLNPESVAVRRRAGLVPRPPGGGPLAALTRADDELLYVGGGLTELTLDLLFDIDLLERSTAAELPVEDVRSLTGPLLRLAESAADERDLPWPPPLRFVWGKAWNMPVVVTAVAERFDRFAPGGMPQRSWLRLRLVRTAEPGPAASFGQEIDGPTLDAVTAMAEAAAEGEPALLHIVAGATDGLDAAGGEADRIDLLAARLLGHPSLWRVLMLANPELEDPLALTAGFTLAVPPLRWTGEGSW